MVMSTDFSCLPHPVHHVHVAVAARNTAWNVDNGKAAHWDLDLQDLVLSKAHGNDMPYFDDGCHGGTSLVVLSESYNHQCEVSLQKKVQKAI